MTPREIVCRCIEFRRPPRIGLHFQTDPIQGQVWKDSDFVGVGYASEARFNRQSGQSEWVTEWGVRRRAINTEVGEAVESPLAQGWHLLDQFPFPDLGAAWRYARLGQEVAAAHAAGLYVCGSIPGLMLLPADLRGMENWLADNILEPDNLGRLMDRILAIRAAIIEHYAAAGVDGVITWDDMGTNTQVFVSPAMFRKLYLPRYKQTIDHLHERRMHFIHHCCGQVRQYVDLFIEAGCDVLQLDQPELMGIDWLAEHAGGRICF